MATTRRSSTSPSAAAARTPAGGTTGPAVPATTKTFVLDTSVLLSDPRAMLRFAEHDVVLPVVVVTELEAKRHHPELGYFARQALRLLDDLRVSAGRLDAPVADRRRRRHPARRAQPHRPARRCPPASGSATTTAGSSPWPRTSPLEGRDVTLVSKDLPMRVKASAVGLDAEEYRADDHRGLRLDRHEPSSTSASSRWTRCTTRAGSSTSGPRAALPHRPGAAQPARRGLGRVGADKTIRLVRGDRDAFGLHGRSAEQRIALDLLLDPDVGIVSLGGRAGTGKSALALCAGLEAVMERRQHRKVVVFRPLYAVGGQELGYLPGSEAEKMNPWAQAVFDTLGALVVQRGGRGGHRPRDARGAAADPHPRVARCTTRSSSSTRRSRSSATCC